MASPSARSRPVTVSIVTGGAGGIGKAIARALAGRGHQLLTCDIDRDAVEAEAELLRNAGGSVIAIDVDIASPESCRSMAATALSRHGRIDALVHAAGIDAPPGRVWEEDDAHWRNIIDVDLNGAWWAAKAVLPQMILQNRGASSSWARSRRGCRAKPRRPPITLPRQA